MTDNENAGAPDDSLNHHDDVLEQQIHALERQVDELAEVLAPAPDADLDHHDDVLKLSDPGKRLAAVLLGRMPQDMRQPFLDELAGIVRERQDGDWPAAIGDLDPHLNRMIRQFGEGTLVPGNRCEQIGSRQERIHMLEQRVHALQQRSDMLQQWNEKLVEVLAPAPVADLDHHDDILKLSDPGKHLAAVLLGRLPQDMRQPFLDELAGIVRERQGGDQPIRSPLACLNRMIRQFETLH